MCMSAVLILRESGRLNQPRQVDRMDFRPTAVARLSKAAYTKEAGPNALWNILAERPKEGEDLRYASCNMPLLAPSYIPGS
jgi:hypothetical protein